MNEHSLSGKMRKPLDLELKRTVENLIMKTTVLLQLSEETVEILNREASKPKEGESKKTEKSSFRNRSDAVEYYYRKGYSFDGEVEPQKESGVRVLISVSLGLDTVKMLDAADAKNRGAAAEPYLRRGFRAEGLI